MRGCGAGGRYDRGCRHTRVEGLSAMEPLDDLDRPAKRTWPAEGVSRVPYWVYTDAEVYRREQQRIFRGASWSYVALAAEIPRPGDFKRSTIGEVPVVVVRAADGRANVLVNRCAHRGVQFCTEAYGSTKSFMCPYHQWTYDLDGNLRGVPFRHGVKGAGGMSADFSLAEHGLERLAVAERHGVVFASFEGCMPALEDYLGQTNLGWFDRVFDGRQLCVLGYQRQIVPANWKLMFENIKDPYHASLLHVFLVSFGLFRADMPSAVQMDASGQHLAQLGCRAGEGESALVEMGGRDLSDSEHIVTEAAIRAFYAHYRRVMEL